MRYYHIL